MPAQLIWERELELERWDNGELRSHKGVALISAGVAEVEKYLGKAGQVR
jgi:hypothetical protein